MNARSVPVELAASEIQEAFPRIYAACHLTHRRAGRHGGDLSQRESTILAHLSPDRPWDLSTLAGHLGVVSSTLSEALQPLVDAGLVRREPDPADRRRCHFTLTPLGVQARADSSVLNREILDDALESLSGQERALIAQSLRRLAETCRQARRRYDAGEEREESAS
ncbi:MAG: MarR family winged helix-turn-helix transcriptional regulator [Thermoanaerobaculia bacterium]